MDETCFGGKRKNLPKHKRKELTGRGAPGKTAVVGARDRATKQVAAKVVASTDAATLQEFVKDDAGPDATVYTDDATANETLPFDHDTVQHSLQEYAKGDVHTSGIESLWSMLKRAHRGTFHKISSKHVDRYVQEFADRHNMRETGHDRSATLPALWDGEEAADLEGPDPGQRICLRCQGDCVTATLNVQHRTLFTGDNLDGMRGIHPRAPLHSNRVHEAPIGSGAGRRHEQALCGCATALGAAGTCRSSVDRYRPGQFPKSRGRAGPRDNLQLLCGACHAMQGTISQAAFHAKLTKQGLR
ncbi:MAG: IS1595 family transposase [Bryobacterales bacterium]|nr:IS1595 family transposase [Bryobacterales bacterium]